jgi:hypothetical protein
MNITFTEHEAKLIIYAIEVELTSLQECATYARAEESEDQAREYEQDYLVLREAFAKLTDREPKWIG